MNLFKLTLSFLKVGTIGFGGGSALIPVIRNELVETQRIVSEEEYLRHTVIANITPGALPVKIGATSGFFLKGIMGAVLGAWAVAVPGVFATVLIIALFSSMGHEAIGYLHYASLGVTVFIFYLLAHYIIKTVEYGNVRTNLVLCALAAVLTGGKKFREMIQLALGLPEHALGVPLFNISIINIMLLAFYLIIFQHLAGKRRLPWGAGLALVYAFFCGAYMKEWPYAGPARLIMAGALLVSLIIPAITRKKDDGGTATSLALQRPVLICSLIFMAIPIVLGAAAAGLGLLPEFGKSAAFLGNILISSVTSFGGGEAYIAIADSLFVQAGYIQADLLYNQIVPVANALPGPIMIKVAAAMGFLFGQGDGSVAGGVVMAVVVTATSIGACCVVAMLAFNYYDALKDSAFVKSLKMYILPVICGTLISTSLSMLCESMKIAAEYGLRTWPTLLVMVFGVLLTAQLKKRLRVNDLILLLISVSVSMSVMIFLR